MIVSSNRLTEVSSWSYQQARKSHINSKRMLFKLSASVAFKRSMALSMVLITEGYERNKQLREINER